MAVFEYTALAGGKTKRGSLTADSPQHAREQLREMGLAPLSMRALAAKGAAKSGKTAARARGKVRSSDLPPFLRQFANLVAAGFPAADAMQILAQSGSPRPPLARLIREIRAAVTEGKSLGQAFAEHRDLFGDEAVSVITVGERSGQLPRVLAALADSSERREAFRRHIVGAMIYPLVLLFVCVAIVAGVLTFVVPQFVSIFESHEAELPLLTRVMLAASDGLQTGGWPLAAAVVVVVFLLRALFRTHVAALWLDRMILRLPVIGGIARDADAVRFCRSMATLQDAGTPAVEGLAVAAKSMRRALLRERVERAKADVRMGGGISRSLEKRRALPPVTLSMIAAGEAGGKLGEMLARDAENREQQVNDRISTMMRLLEPLIILVMGLIVLLVVLAILLPIFEINRLV